jgi:hypothetical protein
LPMYSVLSSRRAGAVVVIWYMGGLARSVHGYWLFWYGLGLSIGPSCEVFRGLLASELFCDHPSSSVTNQSSRQLMQ